MLAKSSRYDDAIGAKKAGGSVEPMYTVLRGGIQRRISESKVVVCVA